MATGQKKRPPATLNNAGSFNKIDSKQPPATAERDLGSMRENSNGNSLNSLPIELKLAHKANEEMSTKITELSSELHKMKAIVLKHEVRIRDLEKLNSHEEEV